MANNETPTLKGNAMKKFIDNLKAQAEANPLVAIAVTAALFTATSKLLDANTARYSAKTHALEISRRVSNSNR